MSLSFNLWTNTGSSKEEVWQSFPGFWNGKIGQPTAGEVVVNIPHDLTLTGELVFFVTIPQLSVPSKLNSRKRPAKTYCFLN